MIKRNLTIIFFSCLIFESLNASWIQGAVDQVGSGFRFIARICDVVSGKSDSQISPEQADALVKAAESAAQNTQKIAQVNDQMSKIANGVGDIGKKVGAVAEGMENVSKVATTFQYVASIAALVHITYNLGSFYKSGRDYFWPTEEQILKQQEVSRKLKIIQAEVPLNECLEDHKRGPIDSDGIPCACQDFLQAFGRADLSNKN